ncbi:unnamed protein product, partial [Prorocentrum cordatum]
MHLERCARLFRPQNAIHLNSIMPPVSKPAGLLSIGGTHTELRADDRAGSVLRELAPKPMKQFRESETRSTSLTPTNKRRTVSLETRARARERPTSSPIGRAVSSQPKE